MRLKCILGLHKFGIHEDINEDSVIIDQNFDKVQRETSKRICKHCKKVVLYQRKLNLTNPLKNSGWKKIKKTKIVAEDTVKNTEENTVVPPVVSDDETADTDNVDNAVDNEVKQSDAPVVVAIESVEKPSEAAETVEAEKAEIAETADKAEEVVAVEAAPDSASSKEVVNVDQIAKPAEPVAAVTEPVAAVTEPVAAVTEPVAAVTEPVAAVTDAVLPIVN